jgi:hypothetical protein
MLCRRDQVFRNSAAGNGGCICWPSITKQLAEELYRKKRGPDDPAVVRAMSRRAWCFAQLERYPEAIAIYAAALEAKTRRGDGEAPTAAWLEESLSVCQSRLASQTDNLAGNQR